MRVVVLLFILTLFGQSQGADLIFDRYAYLGFLELAYTPEESSFFRSKTKKNPHVIAFQNFLVMEDQNGKVINEGLDFGGLKYPTRVFPLNYVSIVRLFDQEEAFPKYLNITPLNEQWVLTSLPFEVDGQEIIYPELQISCKLRKKTIAVDPDKLIGKGLPYAGLIEDPLVDPKLGFTVERNRIKSIERINYPQVRQVYFDLTSIPKKAVCVAQISYKHRNSMGKEFVIKELLKFRRH